MVVKDILDHDLLRTSIEEMPLLWDKTIDSYLDRNERRKCWKDIFCKMKPVFKELNNILQNNILVRHR